MMVHRRCQPCGCDELPPPDCFGCSPPNEPVTWDMDFPEAMTYDVDDEETDTYIDMGVGTCSDPGFVAEEYTMSRQYPDISLLGSGNVCNREPDRPCAWGFFAGKAYGVRTTDGHWYACGDCNLTYSHEFYGPATNVTSNFYYSGYHATNQAALDVLTAAEPAACDDVDQCGYGFWARHQTNICGGAHKFGYAGLLEYVPLTSELVFTVKWIPLIRMTYYYAYNDSGLIGGAYGGSIGSNHAGLLHADVENGWSLLYGDMFPGATSAEDLITSTFLSNNLQWQYSKVVDCSTDFGGSPITLDIRNTATVQSAHDKWSMVDTPQTITVTPNF